VEDQQMKLIGGWLPFIGFREIWLDSDGMPSEYATGFRGNALEVEWLDCGITLMTFGARDAS
jgi:hypothetical protein